MSTRHQTFNVLFEQAGYEPTVCKYREGMQFDEIRSVICDAWGPARFNYDCQGMSLPVNSHSAFTQFLERARRGEVESQVTDMSGETFPVLRCVLLPLPPEDLSAYQQEQQEQQQQKKMNQQQQQDRSSSVNNNSILRPVKPRSGKNEDSLSGVSELRDDERYQQQQQQRRVNDNNNNKSKEHHHVVGNLPSELHAQLSEKYNTKKQQPQQQSSSSAPNDNLEDTQRGIDYSRSSSQHKVSFAQNNNNSGSSSNSRPSSGKPRVLTHANNSSSSSGVVVASSSSSSNVLEAPSAASDTIVCAIRTQVPPTCIQIRVDQGGLIDNLRTHISYMVKVKAGIELPSNFLLSFSRPDCDTNIDVEDDGDFNFLKASIKRIGAESIVLFVDVKHTSSKNNQSSSSSVSFAATATSSSSAAGVVTSPLKPNPFAREAGSPKGNPMNDAARHLL